MTRPKLGFNAATGKVNVIEGNAFDKARVHDMSPQPVITRDEDVGPVMGKWFKEGTSDTLIIRTRRSLQ